MSLRVYGTIWLVLAILAAGFYQASSSKDVVLTLFGFLFATLVAGFFIAVLPRLLDEHFTWKY